MAYPLMILIILRQQWYLNDLRFKVLIICLRESVPSTSSNQNSTACNGEERLQSSSRGIMFLAIWKEKALKKSTHTFRSYIMNGGPLPSNPYLSYKPQCSFDANGLLKNELMSEAGLDHSFSLEDSSTFPIASVSYATANPSRIAGFKFFGTFFSLQSHPSM